MTQFTFPADLNSFIDTGIFIRADGSRALTADWDAGVGRKIQAEAIWARSNTGLLLGDDNGNGLFVQDGGNIGIGKIDPSSRLAIFHTGLDVSLAGTYYFLNSQLTVTGVCTGVSNVLSNNLFVTNNATLDGGALNLFGVQCRVNNLNGYLCNVSYGGFFTSYNTHTVGTITAAMGGYFGVTLNGSGGAINTATAGYFPVVCTAGTITTAYGANISITGAGTITTAYGVYIGTISGSSKWSLYANDANAPSYFAGKVGIGTASPTAQLDLNSDIMRLRTAKTPATAGDTGNVGDICWDSNYIHVCVAANTWKRAALTSW
jgi:hypothetical protein